MCRHTLPPHLASIDFLYCLALPCFDLLPRFSLSFVSFWPWFESINAEQMLIKYCGIQSACATIIIPYSYLAHMFGFDFNNLYFTSIFGCGAINRHSLSLYYKWYWHHRSRDCTSNVNTCKSMKQNSTLVFVVRIFSSICLPIFNSK